MDPNPTGGKNRTDLITLQNPQKDLELGLDSSDKMKRPE